MSIILGIDPGLNKSGWGVIKKQSNERIYMAHGVIKTNPKDPLSIRIAKLCESLEKVISTYSPFEIAIENTFVNKNSKSAILLAMAKGALISVPARHNLPVYEYGANVVKKSVVGFGHADKTQIIYMVKLLLNQEQDFKNDAADALAIAICHSNNSSLLYPL